MDTSALAGELVPYVSAVAAAYGGAVVERVRDDLADSGADAAVGLGRRFLRTVLGRGAPAEPVRDAVLVVARDDGDERAVLALRDRLAELLAADPQLRTEARALLGADRPAVRITAKGKRSVAAQNIYGGVHLGDDPR